MLKGLVSFEKIIISANTLKGLVRNFGLFIILMFDSRYNFTMQKTLELVEFTECINNLLSFQILFNNKLFSVELLFNICKVENHERIRRFLRSKNFQKGV
jgi:hypothetical protein